MANILVADFIKNREWDVQKLKEVFWPFDVEAIRQIPLSSRSVDDSYSWHFEENGIFSVRSGYKVALNTKLLSSPSSRGVDYGWWRKMWGLNIPPKVKHFMWRAFHDLLPCNDNLYRRGICHSRTCPRCGSFPETSFHTLWSCPRSKLIWRSSSFAFLRNKCKALSFGWSVCIYVTSPQD